MDARVKPEHDGLGENVRPYPAVYMMSNRRHGTLYIGMTAALARRVWEHREGIYPGFSQTYGLKRLVWYEPHDPISEAIRREKALKHYRRDWKIDLIEAVNPDWDDLYPGLV